MVAIPWFALPLACASNSPRGAPVVDGGGSGIISGSVAGTPFTSAKTVFWIGAPDSAATTVVYVFSSAVGCSDLQSPGWDTRIPDKSQVLEIKMFGTTAPSTFTVTSSVTPAPGEASVNGTLSSTTGTPSETASVGGSIDLASLSANAAASGSFQLSYPNGGSLMGSFEAVFCPGGHEP